MPNWTLMTATEKERLCYDGAVLWRWLPNYTKNYVHYRYRAIIEKNTLWIECHYKEKVLEEFYIEFSNDAELKKLMKSIDDRIKEGKLLGIKFVEKWGYQ